jgi:hypothetical protein
MNREIKFRVWSIELKRYCKYSSTHIGDDFKTTFGGDKDFIIEQYTGLKDKNGKEIYEGDVGKFYRKHIGKIVYRIGGFFFEEPSGRHTPIQILNPIDCEIIGNIHDNPELLKGE